MSTQFHTLGVSPHHMTISNQGVQRLLYVSFEACDPSQMPMKC